MKMCPIKRIPGPYGVPLKIQMSCLFTRDTFSFLTNCWFDKNENVSLVKRDPSKKYKWNILCIMILNLHRYDVTI